MEFILKKGLNIPIEGSFLSSSIFDLPLNRFSIDLRPYESLHLSCKIKPQDHLQKGSILAQEEGLSPRKILCPVEADVIDVVRGEKRTLVEIILDPVKKSVPVDPGTITTAIDFLAKKQNDALSILAETGLFSCFLQRPFGIPCDPKNPPEEIFIQCLFTEPLSVPASMQYFGNETQFAAGLSFIRKIATKAVHIVTTKNSPFEKVSSVDESGVPLYVHTINDLHPAQTLSYVIQKISPIRSMTPKIWTTTCLDAITLGSYCMSSELWTKQIIAITGPSITPNDRRYVRAYPGSSINTLLIGITPKEPSRMICGSPLTGYEVSKNDYMRKHQTTLCFIPIPSEPILLSFMRFFAPKYTATHTYWPKATSSSWIDTGEGGEKRAFIDTSVYTTVFPLDIPLVFLLKALIANDIDKALHYGLLEIIKEDVALAEFICPSKIPMMDIIAHGQKKCHGIN